MDRERRRRGERRGERGRRKGAGGAETERKSSFYPVCVWTPTCTSLLG